MTNCQHEQVMKVRFTKRGRELMQQAVDTIRAKPERFDMDNWISTASNWSTSDILGAFQEFKESPACGTTLCFAGEIYLAAGCPPIECGFQVAVAELIACKKDIDRFFDVYDDFPLFFSRLWCNAAEITEGTARCYRDGNNEPFLQGIETIIRQGYMTVR